MADQEHDNGPHPFHTEGDAVIFDKPLSAIEASRLRREDEQHEFAHQQVNTNKRLAWFTASLVVATFCTIGVGIWQASISQRSANAARDAVDVASRTLTETQRANAEQRSANAAAARDAKTLADHNFAQTAKGLQATIDNFRQEQRAWIAPKGAAIVSDLAVGKPMKLEIRYANTGRQPAFDVRPLYSITLVDKADFMASGSKSFIESKAGCADKTPASGADVVYPGVEGSTINLASPPNWPSSGLVSGGQAMILQMCFVYTTEKVTHHTSFCYYYLSGTSDKAHLNVCVAGNHAD